MMEVFSPCKTKTIYSTLAIYLIGIDHENNKIKFKYTGNNTMHTSKLYYDNNGKAYFNSYRKRYYLDEFM